MSMTLNKQQVIACTTQCSSQLHYFLLQQTHIAPLQPPIKIHSRRPA
jgi:hypothetical protein